LAKSLKTLIRLYEWRLDEQRRMLGARLKELDRLERGATALEEEIAREQRLAAESPREAGFAYGPYAARACQRREQFAKAIDAKKREVDDAREAVRQAFREVKSYAMTQEARERREAAQRDRDEQAFLDELGLQRHSRRRKAG
jgi:flagellar export protein FliJ